MRKRWKGFFVAFILFVLTFCSAMPAHASAAVKLNKKTASVTVSKTVNLKVTGTNAKVTWKSSNIQVATVDSNGMVTGIKKGTAKITAKVNGKSYICKVTVKAGLSSSKVSLLYGKSTKIQLLGASVKSVKSSNKSVATISKKGKIKAKGIGTATLTITSKNGEKYKCKVTVKVGLNKTSVSLKEGNTKTIKLLGSSIKSVKSSNKSVATITKSGKITAKGAGTCKLTITGKNGKKYKCTVTVTPKAGTDTASTEATVQSDSQPSEEQETQNMTVPDTESETGAGTQTEAQTESETEIEPETTAVYTVRFNSNNGSAVENQLVEPGNTALIPDTPERENFEFVGWYSDRALRKRFSFSTPITGDITLYARWLRSSGDYTRGEWIGILADMVDMNLDVDPNDIDYYYSDTEATEYAIAIETARAYGILPDADVEDLEQDVALFYPTETATREFVAYTTMSAMGFEGDYTADTSLWLDWDEITYQAQAAIAVSFNFMELSDDYFYPQNAISASDIAMIQAAMDELNASAQVSEDDVHDDSVYLETVVKDELSTVDSYSVSVNGSTYTVTLDNCAALALVDAEDVIVLPASSAYPTGLALKVNDVEVGEEQTVITGTVPELEEVYSEIDFAGNATAMTDRMEAAEDVTMTYIPNETSTIAEIGGSASLPGKVEFETKKLELGEHIYAKGKVAISIPDITCRLDASFGLFSGIKVNDFLLSMTEEIELSGTLTLVDASTGMTLTDGSDAFQLASSSKRFQKGRIELGRIPFSIGTTGMSVDVVFYYTVSAKGTASISYTIDMTEGVQYKNGSLRKIFDFRDSLTSIELKASGKAGVGAALDLCAFHLMDLAGYTLEAGVAFNASFTEHDLVTDSLFCADATVYAYASHGLDAETVLGKFLESVLHYSIDSFEVLKDSEDNPYRAKFHVENGVKVAECTYGVSEIKGNVVDSETGDVLPGAKVRVYADETLIRTKYTDSNGDYSIDNLTAAKYKVVIDATGYYEFNTEINLNKNETYYLEATLMVDRENTEEGEVSGSILDATTGAQISDTSYVLRSGWNNTTGEEVETGTFSSSSYTLTLEVGYYTLTVSKEGYVTNSVNLSVTTAGTSNKNVVLSPENTEEGLEGNLRIVLTWGASPRDLDSHLYGPVSDDTSSRFHIYYSDKYTYDTEGEEDGYLDVDDTTSYGPETITVKQMAAEGTYSYYVHDFSNRSSSSSTALSASGAKVEVYVADTLVYTFSVPSNSGGTCWHVFDYDAAAGLIIPVNTFSYVSNPASVASLDGNSPWTDAEWNDIVELLNLPEKESDTILTDEESAVSEEEMELIELDLSGADTEDSDSESADTEPEAESEIETEASGIETEASIYADSQDASEPETEVMSESEASEPETGVESDSGDAGIETEASSESEEMSETVLTEAEAETTTSGAMEEVELSIDAVNPDSGETGASDAPGEAAEDIIIAEE